MRRSLLVTLVLLALRCAAPPTPTAPPEAAPPPPVVSTSEQKVLRTVKVAASALNVRAEASTEAEVVRQVKRGEALAVLGERESWLKVRLDSGETGWVAARFVSDGKAAAGSSRRRGCPADSDFAFTETPTLTFSDSGAHGMVVVEASVNVKGIVTSTKLISNSTGDEALAFLTAREIQSAKFSPPIRACVSRAFLFTYRRTF